MLWMLFYKDVFCDTARDGMTSLSSPLFFPGMKKERWNNSKTEFKVNTESSWQNTEVLGHLAFYSSPEYFCALISPLACGGHDTSIVRSSKIPLDGKLYHWQRRTQSCPQAFLITFLSTYSRENLMEILIKAGIAQCLHPEAKRGLS